MYVYMGQHLGIWNSSYCANASTKPNADVHLYVTYYRKPLIVTSNVRDGPEQGWCLTKLYHHDVASESDRNNSMHLKGFTDFRETL